MYLAMVAIFREYPGRVNNNSAPYSFLLNDYTIINAPKNVLNQYQCLLPALNDPASKRATYTVNFSSFIFSFMEHLPWPEIEQAVLIKLCLWVWRGGKCLGRVRGWRVCIKGFNSNDKFKKSLLSVILLMKRGDKRQQQSETIRQQNHSTTASSSTKITFARQSTLTQFRRQKPLIQLPKIFPIHNSNRHKRYLQSCYVDNDSLNLVGTKFIRKMSRQKKCHDKPHQLIQAKQQKSLLEKQQSHKNIFLHQILANNALDSISFQRKQKIKVFIDQGNNSRLINQLIRRRTNLKIVSAKKDASIVWTQFCDWQQAILGSVFSEHSKQSREPTSQQFQADYKAERIQNNNNIKSQRYREIVIQQLRMHNHFKNHYQISDKKCLFKNIKKYCKTQKINEQDIIPKTYHIERNEGDLPENICEKQAIWIIKPGQDTNRGTGISVQQGRENIVKAIRELASHGKSSLIQEYIDPLLYKNRKFDIRCYALVTSICGNLKAYWYKEGYLRTCSKEFTYDLSNIYGHLTNDAVQKKCKDYGKYEPYNKLSFGDMQVFLKSKEISYSQTLNRMKQLAYISIKSAEDKLRGEKNMFCFQIFGYDFLIDSKGKLWLIQINTNPCLQFCGSLLSRVIWHMVQNSFAIALDPLLMHLPEAYNSWREKNEKIYEDNKFECII